MKCIVRMLFVLIMLAAFLNGQAAGQEEVKPLGKLPEYHFEVQPNFPGIARPTLEGVLRSAANELMQHYPHEQFKQLIVVEHQVGGPNIFYEKNADGSTRMYRIRLSSKSTLYQQHIYQFSHELCHALHNSDLGYSAEVGWFAESLSELASHYVLRTQAKRWAVSPPFSGWNWYGPSFRKYSDAIIKNGALPADQTAAMWYAEHAEDLGSDPLNRRLNLVAATAMLPLFEEDPSRWETMTYLFVRRKELGDRKLAFPEILAEWRHHCPERHKAFVGEIAELFGVAIPSDDELLRDLNDTKVD